MNTKRDYWVICRRNCFALAVLVILAAVFIVSLTKSIILLAILAVDAIVWIVLGRMFNKKSPKAPLITYIFLGLGLALMLLNNLMSPSSFNISSILAYLIYAYFFDCVRRAQKQTANLPVQ